MSRAFHVLQTRGHYCVAACVVMIERWRGKDTHDIDTRQAEVFAEIAVGGYASLDAAAAVLGRVERYGYLDVDSVASLQFLVHRLQSGSWALVSCFTEPLDRVLQARGLRSPHGSLRGGAYHHALVLIAADDRSVAALDPWHGPDDQPVLISYEEFVGAWTGETILLDRG